MHLTTITQRIGATLVMAFTTFQTNAAEPATNAPAPLPLDLSRAYHTNFFATDYKGPGEALLKGVQKIDGIPFQIIGQAGVWGRILSALGTEYPRRLDEVTVGQKFDELHLVHHAFWSTEDGVPVATLRFKYSDGTTNETPILYGAHVRDWFQLKYEERQSLIDTNGSKIWWVGSQTNAPRRMGSLRMFKSTFTNPHPAKVVRAIDFVSTESPASYCLIAATVAPKDPKRKADPQIKTGEPDRKFDGVLTVRVTDAVSSQPLADAMLDVHVSDDTGSYPLGMYFTADKGLKALRYPTQPITRFYLIIKRDGYVGKSITLSKAPFPADLDIRLEVAQLIGGTVKDEDGQPVEGARVNGNALSNFDPDATERTSFSFNDVKTDAQGRWSAKAVPSGATNFSLNISHSNYVTKGWVSDGAEKRYTGDRVAVAELRAQTAQFVLQRGITITGTVADPEGQPVTNASVNINRYQYGMNTGNAVKTDAEGKFTRNNVAPEDKYLSVTADGFVPLRKAIVPTPDAPPLALTLERGQRITGRVEDKEKNPIEGASVSFRHNYDSSSSASRQSVKTDAEGKFAWNGASDDGVTATATKEGYTQASSRILPGQEKEAVITLAKAGEITGTVTDADTGKPIPSFKVVIGESFGGGGGIYWRDSNAKSGKDGKFSVTLEQGDRRYAIKVEADDYSPAVSDTIRNTEESRTMDFALYKGGKLKGTVVLPSGQPVAGADVAMVVKGPSSSVRIVNRRLQSYSSNGKSTKTDAQGQFEVKIEVDADDIVVVHPDGFAQTSVAALQANPVVVLQQYGRIEGLVLRDGEPLPGKLVTLHAGTSSIGGLQFDFNEYKMESDAQGRFTMENVPPGEMRLTELKKMTENSWRHARSTPVVVRPAETTRITFGAENSQSVLGRASVVLPDGSPVDWSQASGSLSTQYPSVPADIRKNPEAVEAYYQSAEYKAAQKARRSYSLDFASDGTFRADDIEPGEYTLNVRLEEQTESPSNFSSPRRSIASGSTKVTVTPGGTLKLDVGTVPMKYTPPPKKKSPGK